jgi:ketosteroid isomerase-like protein
VVEVGARDANRVLGSLSHAYEDGDLQRMRTLFAEDAHGPRGGLDSILAEYNRVFEDTRQRSLSVRDVNWFLSGDTFTIIASFEATVTSNRTGRARRSRGDLRLDLRREGERWQIYRMQHDEKPG